LSIELEEKNATVTLTNHLGIIFTRQSQIGSLAMKDSMICFRRRDNQVARLIVSFILIIMVDLFTRLERFAPGFLSFETMFVSIATDISQRMIFTNPD